MTSPNDPRRAAINRLPTGVPGLDEVLGGGLPEYALVLIAGDPGTGKTTLAHRSCLRSRPERRRSFPCWASHP
jgi:circadian clock protein KaiC